jgi:hypothetical protein
MTPRLSPEDAAEAIHIATQEWTGGSMSTMPAVMQGNILVVPSRAPIPNAPVSGIHPDGRVVYGNVPRLIILKDAQGKALVPLQIRLEGTIKWE